MILKRVSFEEWMQALECFRYVRVYPALATDEAEMQQAVLQQNMGPQDSIGGSVTFPVLPEKVFKSFRSCRNHSENVSGFSSKNSSGRGLTFDRTELAKSFTNLRFPDGVNIPNPVLSLDSWVFFILPSRTTWLKTNGHGPGLSDSVVKIKSLPFDANQLDIIQFFEGFRLKPNGVQLVVRSDNKPTGEAFVDFEAPDEAARAIREKDHKVFSDKFGDRYVRLIQVSRKEMQATLALRFGGEGILKIKGIPFKVSASVTNGFVFLATLIYAQAADIRKFFGAYKIKPDGISFIMHVDGRPTGMAFIEFETPQEAVRAMEKDRAKFGPEYGDRLCATVMLRALCSHALMLLALSIRFCMLQLVGRHEMDKVQLQRESDISNPNKVLNGINILQAAAIATQAALNNPALRPLMQAQAQAVQAQAPAAVQPTPAPLQQPSNTLGLLSSPLSPAITQAAAAAAAAAAATAALCCDFP
ncbi:hypothetical protein DUNSADRAFT_3879 [Dunaliella salina]|uniref:RRM domain-containing protein n=1 Tax=Dunaliella salina TaxID=3046 RepID=A0ABQ7FV36_DUNSA|nr:hypothetical protein DUNSADRAFT_3879 [Dunaliella salina]|eukprot:KAF5826258.1 hypothetical protein DUNSADRAFT_3879 [Dunaliella salina]